MAGNPYKLIGASGMTGAQVAAQNPKPPKPPKVKRPPKPRPPVRPAYTDPFAPLSEQQILSQSQAATQGILGPILQQIRDTYAQRSASGQAAIGSLTKELGGLWQGVGPASQAIYDRARVNEGGIAGGLANQLGTFGQNLQGELGSKLALQNAPAGLVQQVAGGAGQTAQGVANANFAKTSAGLEMLNTQGAAAGAYGAKLPGIAALTGLQSSKQLQAQLNKEMADALSQATTQAAQQAAASYQHMKDLELQKAEYAALGYRSAEKTAADAAYKQAMLKYKYDTLNYKKLNDQANRQAKKAAASAKAKAAKAKAAAAKAKTTGAIGSGVGTVVGGGEWTNKTPPAPKGKGKGKGKKPPGVPSSY